MAINPTPEPEKPLIIFDDSMPEEARTVLADLQAHVDAEPELHRDALELYNQNPELVVLVASVASLVAERKGGAEAINRWHSVFTSKAGRHAEFDKATEHALTADPEHSKLINQMKGAKGESVEEVRGRLLRSRFKGFSKRLVEIAAQDDSPARKDRNTAA